MNPGNNQQAVSDVKRVVIGDSLARPDQGQYYVPGPSDNSVLGARGFKKQYRDKTNQMRHTAAGLSMAYDYGDLGTAAAVVQELNTNASRDKLEIPDLRLHLATGDILDESRNAYWIGRLAKRYPKGLAEIIRDEILDESVVAKPSLNSFAPGTAIMMAEGRSQPIETLQAGDTIVSYDEGGRLIPGIVHEMFEHITDEFLCLKFADGRPPLLITPGHQVETLDGDHDEIINLVGHGHVTLLDHRGKPVDVHVTRLAYDETTAHLLPEDESGEGWITYNLEVDPFDTFIAGGIRVADRPDEGEMTYEEAVLAALVEQAAIEEMLAEETREQANNDPYDYSTVVTPDGRLISPQDTPKRRRKKHLTEAEDYAGFVTPDGHLIPAPA